MHRLINREGPCLVTAHNVEHVLYRYFVERSNLKEAVLHSDKYSNAAMREKLI